MNSDTLKRLGISAFVIIVLVGYVVFQKSSDSNKSNTATTTSTTATTPTTSTTDTTATQQPATTTAAMYKDGTYTGSRTDAFYGFIQVKATISGGKITDVTFVEHPTADAESNEVNDSAMPKLKSEAIQAQSANVNNVSGATDTTKAFVESLNNALNQAKA